MRGDWAKVCMSHDILLESDSSSYEPQTKSRATDSKQQRS